MSRKRPSIGGLVKDIAVKLAREAERYVGAEDASLCASCSHQRSDHCGCGSVCLAPENPDDKGKGSYRHCACEGFAPKPEAEG